MKGIAYIQVFVVAVVASLATSCSSPGTTTTSRRFHEGTAVNLVLRFYSWNSIYMTRPDTREGGFLPLMSRDEVAREAARRQVPRDLAVVIIGYTYGADQITGLAREWKQFLAAQGFRRVVILRSGYKQQIDGLPIVDDSAIGAADDTPGISTAAAIPSAVGADVAHPPIAANR